MKIASIPTEKELFYNTIADKWEKKINNRETEKRIKVIFDQLLNGVDLKNKKVLEVGCGLGFFSKKMYRKGALITGIDVGEKLVKITSKKIPGGKFLVGSALDIPFRKNEFDIILCTEVIEHTEDPKRAISELFRVTKQGGIIIITTPNKTYKPLFDLLSFLKIRLYQGNEKWLGTNELKTIILKNKGKITSERHFNFIYPSPMFDWLERYGFLQNLMINQGYRIKK
jgi:2-polyprenyl-3-methyl-5-hydroxy-6-metoxy-1,4-benzoquinol methylase